MTKISDIFYSLIFFVCKKPVVNHSKSRMTTELVTRERCNLEHLRKWWQRRHLPVLPQWDPTIPDTDQTSTAPPPSIHLVSIPYLSLFVESVSPPSPSSSSQYPMPLLLLRVSIPCLFQFVESVSPVSTSSSSLHPLPRPLLRVCIPCLYFFFESASLASPSSSNLYPLPLPLLRVCIPCLSQFGESVSQESTSSSRLYPLPLPLLRVCIPCLYLFVESVFSSSTSSSSLYPLPLPPSCHRIKTQHVFYKHLIIIPMLTCISTRNFMKNKK